MTNNGKKLVMISVWSRGKSRTAFVYGAPGPDGKFGTSLDELNTVADGAIQRGDCVAIGG